MAPPVFIYSFAASLDGFIADTKDGVDWLNAFHDADYGMEEFFRSVDALVMGRKTYEVGLKLGMPPSGHGRTVVLSRTLKPSKHKVEIWNGTVQALAKALEKQGLKRIWMMGGGVTASAFLEAGLLDELEIATMPIVLGAGIPMFGKMKEPVRMQLTRLRQFDNGVILRSYKKSEAAPERVIKARVARAKR